MRLTYAKWLLEFIEEHGIGLERGEYAEWQEAEFRVYGTVQLPRAEILPIESDVVIEGGGVLSWEPEVLAGMAHELVTAIILPNGQREDDGT